MSEYEIGRDIQELKSRLDRLEAGLPGGQGPHGPRRVAAMVHAGVREKHPILWKQQRGLSLPTFAHGMLGLAPDLKVEDAESKTWPGSPDPFIFLVEGSGDEYFRLVNMLFSVIRYNNGTVATAIFQARLIASGKATNLAQGCPAEYVSVDMTNDAGAIINSFGQGFFVACDDDRNLVVLKGFEPALYDLVSGANWGFTGGTLVPC